MAVNFIDFVTSLIYGNLGASEVGPAPPGERNHLNWTLDLLPSASSSSITGEEFLRHHIDVMLNRYEAWRSKYFLPPVRPWEFVPVTSGESPNIFPGHDASEPPVGPVVPVQLRVFPAGWTLSDLGDGMRNYYNALRNSVLSGRSTELDDEIKAPFTYRYWAFMKWASDVRKRFLGEPVFPVPIIYDRDGTILSEKEFTDHFNKVHHVWHPNAGTSGSAAEWTQETPGFKTSVGQHRRKKEISRTQVGAEFFSFHRDHLLLFDRWLARTGQDPVQSINMCAHDTSGGPLPSPPSGLDEIGSGLGYPVVNYTSRAVDFVPPHDNMWDGTRAGFDGTLREFSSVGEMGQFFAMDFNPFPSIPVPGAASADQGYHGPGHTLNGDIRTPFANNYVPRFFGWHGFIDDLWSKRQPRFVNFDAVQANGSDFPKPAVLTIIREFPTSTDSVEPAGAIQSLDMVTGNGTLRCKIRIRADPFGRPLELTLNCDVLREASGSAPVISLPSRSLIITVGPPSGINERQQNIDFIEDFVFDGSAGTIDVAGKGPFASDNLSFPPTGPNAVGFLNSLIRIRGTLTSNRRPDGLVSSAAGTVSSSGTTVTGSGSSFTALFRQGDLIRAAGQVRTITGVTSNTSLTILSAFSAAVPAGTIYERLDGFDHEQMIEIPLVQEKVAPDITVYLDRSSFSKDQVDAIVSGGQSVFTNAFYVVLQDRTVRPAPIAWPAGVEPQLYGLIAPQVRAAGLFPDPSHAPIVELRDAVTDTSLAGQVDVAVTAIEPEDPSLHPSIPQRITYRCRVTFTGNSVFTGMSPGDTKDMKLVVTAVDRSGNSVTNNLLRVRLQVNANPYMLDGPVSWLSIDTRVFKIQQSTSRFGVSSGWTDPNAFIQQVIDNLRIGNGTAGGESFDSLPQDQEGSWLEYSTQVNGVNVYNFALGKVRLQSVTGANGVRASLRLFRWGVANVSFDETLAYRSDPVTGIALLGRTSSNELASIPFFAAARVSPSASMITQSDSKNVDNFGPTGGVEKASFFGAYLDINQSTALFPQTFVSDGGFSGVPPSQMRSIRDLLIGQHQCMILEIYYPLDPIPAGSTPGTSDNLSQRNLLILRTANPGSEITRTVQHSFNIDLTRVSRKIHGIRALHSAHVRPTTPSTFEVDGENGDSGSNLPRPARPTWTSNHSTGMSMEHSVAMLKQSWMVRDSKALGEILSRSHKEEENSARWQIDLDEWKRLDGLDELVFFWNSLPTGSEVEVYLPAASAEEIINYRNLRHSPGTVKIVDSHTLRLLVTGPTYLPIPPFWGNNLAGMVTITLPEGIQDGQKFLVDVVQLRSDLSRVLGGFELNIQVSKAKQLFEDEKRMLMIFHKRLSLTSKDDRWHPILSRQVKFFRNRAKGFAEQANDPNILWEDPTEKQKGQKIRIVLEQIQIRNDHDPLLKESGEFRFKSTVYSRNNDGVISEMHIPQKGTYNISDKSGRNTLGLDIPLFEGFVENHVEFELSAVEKDTFDPDDRLCSYKRVFVGDPKSWIDDYGPSDQKVEPENLGDWMLWYRIERA